MTRVFLSVSLATAIFSALAYAQNAPPADVIAYAGLSAEEACKKATLPPGFKMHVFAAEPEVVQPIAFCLDHRGRVWVAEGLTYPKRRGHPPADNRPASERAKPSPEQLKDIFGGADRVLIFEDTDGDHKADKKTVFLENVNLISGLEVGFGGVWIGAAPYLLFVPIRDWDNPKPAGDPRILLEGWDYKADTHETLNTFTWGPDGWLYGCHGVFCPSNVGKPGGSPNERQWMDAGVWRYHPTRHVFEVFTEGGSNPWGIDFDEHGQLWAEMCVIPHLWHMIQGARLQRQGGEHFPINAAELARYRRNPDRKPVHPHIYEDIQTHADHVHWAGERGPHAANARSDAVGGGHAHAGVMCYLGESWPAEYRGKLFLGNIHGQRLNVDIPERRGSGYVGKHGKDFLNFNDTWSQTLNQLYDQDGSVYIIDWYDANQCHHGREDGHDRGNGRIYKVVYNNQKPTKLDLAKESDEQLAKLAISKNEFKSRHARRLLQHRASDGKFKSDIADRFREEIEFGSTSAARLRALWTLHLLGKLDAVTVIENLKHSDEWIRGWTIQLALESQENIERLVREATEKNLEAKPDLNDLAESDPSPLVRLFVASAAQRAPNEEVRAKVVERLLKRSEDASDHNLPLMVWFAMEPLVIDHPREALSAALRTPLPKILNFTARRIAALGTDEGRNLLTEALRRMDDAGKQRDILAGFSAALKGERKATMPQDWEAVEEKFARSRDPEIRILSQTLSLTFGSVKALASLRNILADDSAPVAARRTALDALTAARDADLPPVLQALVRKPELRGAAIKALGAYSDSKTPDAILGVYSSLNTAEKRDALNTLASRPLYATALLSAISSKQVPSKDLTAETVRQLRNLKDASIEKQLTDIYGTTRETSADKRQEIERYRAIYRAGGSQPGYGSPGRVVYNKVCAQCHTLFDSGGKVGPDITGANRSDLNYLLETIIDPNAVIPNEYRASDIETKDGRNLVGVIKSQDDKSVTLQTANELITLPRAEIATTRQSELSMMPEGLLQGLTDQEVRDLLYYLSRPGQVPLPTASQ
jgi:putative membrane-bound dehydrogenase-like protein